MVEPTRRSATAAGFNVFEDEGSSIASPATLAGLVAANLLRQGVAVHGIFCHEVEAKRESATAAGCNAFEDEGGIIASLAMLAGLVAAGTCFAKELPFMSRTSWLYFLFSVILGAVRTLRGEVSASAADK